jgi:hypothetical protein
MDRARTGREAGGGLTYGVRAVEMLPCEAFSGSAAEVDRARWDVSAETHRLQQRPF